MPDEETLLEIVVALRAVLEDLRERIIRIEAQLNEQEKKPKRIEDMIE